MYHFYDFSHKIGFIQSSEDAKRLLDDMLSNYNNLVRPVEKPTDTIKLFLGIKLSQISDIVRKILFFLLSYILLFIYVNSKDERNQIMTTNVWVRHVS